MARSRTHRAETKATIVAQEDNDRVVVKFFVLEKLDDITHALVIAFY